MSDQGKAIGDAAAAKFAVGTRVRISEEEWVLTLRDHRRRYGPRYGRDGRVVKVTRSWRYGHAYIHVAWRPGATWPRGTFEYLDGHRLEVIE